LSKTKSAFAYTQKVTLFDYLSADPAKAARFGRAMVAWSRTNGAETALALSYPWGTETPGTIVCDIGGGVGHVSMALIRAFPHIHVVLQDLGVVIDQARLAWEQKVPEVVESGGAKMVPMNFFEDSPLPNCDFYYMKHILHDWPVDECVTILKNITKSMKQSSKVFIHEFILPPPTRVDDSAVDQAPEPLLANYGVGNSRLYNLDINMMAMLNSKERTLAEYINLGDQAGLKVVKLWDCGEMGIVELELK